MTSISDPHPQKESRSTTCASYDWFRVWTGLTVLILMAVTWRLWLPQQVFPQIPLFGFLVRTPGWIDVAFLLLLISALLCFACVRSYQAAKAACIVLLIGQAGMIALDQHRLQAWFYELAIVALLIVTTKRDMALACIRLVLISLYIHSAIGKFDYQYLHNVGQQMLGTLLSFLGTDMSGIPEEQRVVFAAALPICELVVGVALLFRPSRRIAVGMLALFHLAIIAVLGPLGLNHHWGVLIWNIQVAGQAMLLFLPASNALPWEIRFRDLAHVAREYLAVFVLAGLVVVMPLLERIGYFDHWLSWALYAPHSSRVRVEVAAVAVPKLPAELQSFVVQEPGYLYAYLAIDRWSLTQLSAPIYPQDRFQLGVAESVASYLGRYDVRVTLQSTASRWSGLRNEQVLMSVTEVKRAGDHYWFNTQPRHSASHVLSQSANDEFP